MRRRLLASYLTITLVTLLVLVVPLGYMFASRERDRLLRDMEHDATVVAGLAEDALEQGKPPAIDAVLAAYERDPGGRIVIVDPTGRSVADSATPGRAGVDFSTRPEFAAALSGNRSEGTRHSDTVGADLLYVAIPVASSGIVHGAVRVTYTSATLDERVRNMWIGLAALSLLVITVVSALGFALARLVTRPVERLKVAAQSIASGELDARAPTDSGAPELRELAAIFNETASRLAEILRMQDAFVADASHQLRTPLAALRLQLENIESVAPSDLQPALASARSEAARLSRISEALLTLTRTASASICAPVDAASVIAERVQLWEPVATAVGVALRVTSPAHAWVTATPGALEQILDNLIDNALDVAPPDTELRLEIAPDTQTTEIHVIDSGPGLASDDRLRALDRFWRGPNAEPGGTGLGLAIVAQLVAGCGGTIELRANVPSGIDAVVVLRTEVDQREPR